MRELTFVVEPGIGPEEMPQRGSLADLVLALPYVVMDAMPPRRVLNDVLREGILQAGMSGGCLWEPFEIGAAEYEELVQELRRGGRGLETPEPPDSVATYSDWVDYLYEQRTGSTPPGPPSEREDASPSYDRWLERLPVADLYLGYLEACDRDWRARDDDAWDLPAELVSKLRELAGLVDDWHYGRGGLHDAENQEWLRDWANQAERVRQEALDIVDRVGLPRWPYARLTIDAS
jgi:hypothetical protein